MDFNNEKLLDHYVSDLGTKEISRIEIVNNTIVISFNNATYLHLWDDGQSCCEERWIDTDDDLSSLNGSCLFSIEERPGNYGTSDEEDEEDEGYEGSTHDVVFLHVYSSLGTIVFCTHNEHNGYYGGFDLQIEETNASVSVAEKGLLTSL